jgi:CBS domain-containing protein
LAGARVVEDPPGDVSHEHHRTVGVVTSWELARRASMGEAEVPVQRVMHVDWPSVHPEDDGAKTLDTLANGQAPAVVVRDGGDEIIGLVTAEDVRRAVAIAAIGGASSIRH